MLIQKSKSSSAFDEQKVKNIDYNRFSQPCMQDTTAH